MEEKQFIVYFKELMHNNFENIYYCSRFYIFRIVHCVAFNPNNRRKQHHGIVITWYSSAN